MENLHFAWKPNVDLSGKMDYRDQGSNWPPPGSSSASLPLHLIGVCVSLTPAGRASRSRDIDNQDSGVKGVGDMF